MLAALLNIKDKAGLVGATVGAPTLYASAKKSILEAAKRDGIRFALDTRSVQFLKAIGKAPARALTGVAKYGGKMATEKLISKCLGAGFAFSYMFETGTFLYESSEPIIVDGEKMNSRMAFSFPRLFLAIWPVSES